VDALVVPGLIRHFGEVGEAEIGVTGKLKAPNAFRHDCGNTRER